MKLKTQQTGDKIIVDETRLNLGMDKEWPKQINIKIEWKIQYIWYKKTDTTKPTETKDGGKDLKSGFVMFVRHNH